ncbi:glutamine---fructose-6-phosphate transaminase (isomerizing) [Enteropsectra breve]|nr:glutamine---fructose-6-phosphate transaminase (isomerizing) [Enteropsectra breve]
MCGIFALAGFFTRKDVLETIMGGISKLERRGYDSAGLAILNDSEVFAYEKASTLASGELHKLVEKNFEHILQRDDGKKSYHIGLGHTRWATHGGADDDANAHPHCSHTKAEGEGFFVVHNGMVDNFKSLKDMLVVNGYSFEGCTDSEVIAKLAHFYYEKDNKASLKKVAMRIRSVVEGASAFVITSSYHPNEIVGFTINSSPLLLGCNFNVSEDLKYDNTLCSYVCKFETEHPTKNFYFASDSIPLQGKAHRILCISNGMLVSMGLFGLEICMLGTKDTKPEFKNFENNESEEVVSRSPGFYMHKEIEEQEHTIQALLDSYVDFDTVRINIPNFDAKREKLAQAKRFLFIACGTSYYSCLSTRMAFEQLTNAPTVVEIGSKAFDEDPIITSNDVIFFVSQSGETLDVISFMRVCAEKKAFCVLITNTEESAMKQYADLEFNVMAGVENAVASTKAYTSQYTSILLIAMYIAQAKNLHFERRREIIKELHVIPGLLRQVIQSDYSRHSRKFRGVSDMMIVARGWQYSTCLEAALKIKETVYLHAEGMLAGEIKHGPIALVHRKFSCMMIIVNDEYFNSTLNIYQMLTSRKCTPLIVCTEDLRNQFTDCITVPKTNEYLQGLITIIPFQIMAYEMSIARGINPDRPKNLAKTVTV